MVSGETCVLETEFTGAPYPTIKWYFQNEEITSSDKYEFVSEDDGRKHKLLIKNCTTANKGTYSMAISNKLGKATTKCDVAIVYAPRLVKQLTDIEIAQKKTAILETEIDAYPASTIQWFKNGQPIDLTAYELEGRYGVFDRKGGVYQLTIKNCKPEDMGKYTVTASNKLGQVESSANLTIITPPAFVKKFDQVDAVENCEFKINVVVSAHPMPEVAWSKNGAPIDLKDTAKYALLSEPLADSPGNYSFTLVCKTTTKSDAGSYQCVATNNAGRASCLGKVSLHPLTPPKFVIELPKEQLLPESKEVSLSVKATGIPVPKVNWFKDNQLLTDESAYILSHNEVDNTHTLKSKEVSPLHSGVYTAKAVNPGGEAKTECKLTIKGTLPYFTNKPEKITCLEGTVAELGCSFGGEPQPTVSWTFKNKDIKDDNKYKLTFEPQTNSSILSIQKCSKQDEGTYIVTIKNVHGVESTAVSLMITQNAEEVQDFRQFLKATEVEKQELEEVKVDWGTLKEGKPIEKEKEDEEERIKLRKVELLPRFIKEPADQRVIKEKEACFEAVVKSSTKVNVSWIRMDKEIVGKEGIRIEKDINKNSFRLTIKRASNEHEGEIRCVATNEHGSCEKTCHLTIIGKTMTLYL